MRVQSREFRLATLEPDPRSVAPHVELPKSNNDDPSPLRDRYSQKKFFRTEYYGAPHEELGFRSCQRKIRIAGLGMRVPNGSKLLGRCHVAHRILRLPNIFENSITP